MTQELRNEHSFIRFQRAFLIVIGFLYISRGVQIWIAPEETVPSWALLHQMLPSGLHVGLWMVTGLISLIAGLKGKTPSGFFVIMIMPAECVVSYAWSFVMYLIPGEPQGHLGSLAWFVWWVYFLLVLNLVAAWPELNRKYFAWKATHEY